ncbi:pilus assembly protein PilP [Geobacter sp. DSM 9736]|uniref:pilus assembly protein PilP n=1 Tax=Geobacter sp. DSM 9736 TaxID=1277350 RepID=UPI000B501933|nr:pilus assembly protein PilP [Geobacter sp. DSM 9736]SNB46189.1 type IV pilus assembly protein PilP [Geobacter sp. DSM 9736]
MRKNKDAIVVLLLLALLLWGCKKEEQVQTSPPPKPEQVAKQQPVQKQTSSAMVQQNPQQFDFSKAKDPFKPFIAQPPKPAPATDHSRSGSGLPMESFELSRFRVAGIVIGHKQSSALIIDPNGKGYVVKPGMSIGTSNGRITRISAAAVEVEEKYVADNGRARKRTVVLSLPQKK